MNRIFPFQVELTNFGALRYAKFDVAALTIVCGKNNMGKTYATYALFGFLDFWWRGCDLDVAGRYVEELSRTHQINIPLKELVSLVPHWLKKASSEFSHSDLLSEVFGSEREFFKNAKFDLSVPEACYPLLQDAVSSRTGTNGGSVNDGKVMQISWKTEEGSLCLTLTDGEADGSARKFLMTKLVGEGIKDAIMGCLLPKPFIACAERTGAVIFQKELDFTRNRLLEMIGERGAKDITPLRFLKSFSSRYPIPVRRNVDTARDIPEESSSFLVTSKDPRCKGATSLFCEIIGGKYKVVKGEMRFVPDEGQRVKLDMVLSSSSVRALMHLGIYLFYQAKPGDMLMIDEPEQNLHPENQRKMARLLARLANLGVRVFITTHSDYIVRELNTLIMLSSGNPFADSVRKRYHYGIGDSLNCDDVRVYSAAKEKTVVPGHKRRSMVNTLSEANVDSRLGIDARTFDETISEMNQIQQELYCPGESHD